MDKTNVVVNLAMVCIVVAVAIALTIIVIRVTATAVDADEYECNLLYCTFKKTIKEMDCYQNGELVDCTLLDIDEYDKDNWVPR